MADSTVTLLEGHETIIVRAWRHEDGSRIVVHPRDEYVYWCWTPVLGTLCIAVGQRLACWADDAGVEVALRDLAVMVGHPGSQCGRHSPMVRSIARLVRFGLAGVEAPGEVRMRTSWPLLSVRLASRLPDALRRCHDDYVVALGRAR